MLRRCKPIVERCGSWAPRRDLRKENRANLWRRRRHTLNSLISCLSVIIRFITMELQRGTSGMIAVCVNESGSSRCVFMVPPGSKRLFSPFLCHSDCRRSPAVGLSCHSQAPWATTETLLTLAFILLLQTLNWIIPQSNYCCGVPLAGRYLRKVSKSERILNGD